MRPRTFAATLLVMLLSASAGWACDSYDDDMSLASVLARAVAEARAQGTLHRGTLHEGTLHEGTLQEAGALAIAPEQAAAGAAPAPKS